jgi:uncharacterized protein (DUF58 family)
VKIVPSNRLILFFALIVPPLLALGALLPPAFPLAVVLGGGLLLCAILDAFKAGSVFTGLKVQTPEFTRLQKGRPGSFQLTLLNESRSRRLLRIGCVVSPAIVLNEEIRQIAIAAIAERMDTEWACTPMKRGLFRLDTVVLESASPWGFWLVRDRRNVEHDFRVYPDLLAERQRVAALFLRRGMTGSHVQRRAGQGREFEKLRDYVPGDSLSDVHWKASAKRRHLVTKIHQIERSHEVYVVVDASRLSARGIAGQPGVSVLERYVTATLILGAAAERQGDQFGLITFSDRVLTFLRARAGQAHFDTCREHLYTLQPRQVTPDFDEVLSFIRSRLNKRALLIVLTSLDDPFLADSFVESATVIARQHLILVNMLQPNNVRPVFANPEVQSVDDLYHELGGHLQWEKLRELEKVLSRRGIRFALLDPIMISAELVRQHTEVRERELV